MEAGRKPRRKFAGVYVIRNLTSGRVYYGSSNDITGRYTHHRFCLRRGIHKNKPLQADWTKLGEDCFEFKQFVLTNDYRGTEQKLIDYDTTAYNQPKFSGPSPKGRLAALARWQRDDYKEKQKRNLEGRSTLGRFQNQAAAPQPFIYDEG